MPIAVEPVLAPGTLARLDQPVLFSAELTMRPWQRADTAEVACAYSQPDIQRWHARSMDELEAEEWVRSRSDRWQEEKGADWAITDESGVIGRIGLTHLYLAEGLGEVVYWVLPEARGRGVATRALCAMTDWAFDQLGLHRLELKHSTENLASCRVAQIAFYGFEGTKREEALHPDGWHDMHLHARLAGDARPDLSTTRS
ncbi:MAG: GNAT family N-acetyltransferase [Solirubrobacteraceae bacterium]